MSNTRTCDHCEKHKAQFQVRAPGSSSEESAYACSKDLALTVRRMNTPTLIVRPTRIKEK